MQTLERISKQEAVGEPVRLPPPETLELRSVSPPSKPAEPRTASARDVLVTILVCLTLWAFLAAPALERNAGAGPVGIRRTAALAILRPLVMLSDGLLVTRATSSIERALGQDPNAPPGGELAIPDLDLPTEVFEPRPAPPAPAAPSEGPDRESPTPPGRDEDPLEEPVAAAGLRSPTPSNPIRIAVIGDSLSQGLGPAIEHWVNPSFVSVLSLGRQSTGLSREDYFNWQNGMRQIEDAVRPDLVFVMLGSNDGQAQISRGGAAIPVGTFDWVKSYRERAADLLRTATRGGTHVVWVGVPIVSERERWNFYRDVNTIYRETARGDPLATYLDTWSPFEANNGGYTAFVRDQRGELLEMRASDGIHFTPAGYAYLGRLAIEAAARSFGLAQEAVTFKV